MPWYEALAFAFVCLALIEPVCRFIIFPLRAGKKFYVPIQAYQIFEYDRRTGYRLQPFVRYSNPTTPLAKAPRRVTFVDVRTDANGFLFDGDIAQLRGRKIVCIGDSSTAGLECRHDRHYPAVLDRFLQAHGCRCINAGVGGYRSIHHLRHLMKRVLPVKPWGILLFSGYNDFEDFAEGISRPHDPFSHCLRGALPGSDLEYFWVKSATRHYLERLIEKTVGPRPAKDPPPRRRVVLQEALEKPTWLPEWRENIRKIIATCKRRNIRVFVLRAPSPVFSGASDEAKTFADQDLNMNGRFEAFVGYVNMIDLELRSICDASNATYLDIEPLFSAPFVKPDGAMDYKARFGIFVDRHHLTERGTEHLAACAYQLMKEHL
jgi:lysophospholipase L1-like esterase